MARPPRVLIVDDRPKLLGLCARALEDAGFEAHTAPTAQVAMDVVEAAPPDAILIDLQVPFVNGLGVLYRLRKAHAHIPVAVITGMSNLDDAAVKEIRALGADVRVKPMSVDGIQTIARELLAKRDTANLS
jgi:DNA-binding NtrC family response regulator